MNGWRLVDFASRATWLLARKIIHDLELAFLYAHGVKQMYTGEIVVYGRSYTVGNYTEVMLPPFGRIALSSA